MKGASGYSLAIIDLFDYWLKRVLQVKRATRGAWQHVRRVRAARRSHERFSSGHLLLLRALRHRIS
eukprot:4465036-Pyramimonas_sp.AAC.1